MSDEIEKRILSEREYNDIPFELKYRYEKILGSYDYELKFDSEHEAIMSIASHISHQHDGVPEEILKKAFLYALEDIKYKRKPE